MRSLLTTSAKGLPSLVGVMWGALALGNAWSISTNAAVLGGGLAVGWIGRRTVKRAPLLALLLMDLSIVATIAIVSFCTWTVLALATTTLPLFPARPADQQKALSGALVGALTTYFALVWTKDIADGTGPLWPSNQFKAAIGHAFSTGSHVPDRASLAYSAIFEDRVPAKNINGWGYGARWSRAWIIHDFVKT
jgi:hypothetical protein